MKPSTTHRRPPAAAADASDNSCSDPLTILPIRDTMDVLFGKWKLPILGSLFSGSKRFKQLQRDVKGITPKMLSKELKDLELNGLVTRTVYDTTPVSVEYAMTDYGSSLRPVVTELHKWGTEHRRKIRSMSGPAEERKPKKARHLRLVGRRNAARG